jgi:hypothetical protein
MVMGLLYGEGVAECGQNLDEGGEAGITTFAPSADRVALDVGELGDVLVVILVEHFEEGADWG